MLGRGEEGKENAKREGDRLLFAETVKEQIVGDLERTLVPGVKLHVPECNPPYYPWLYPAMLRPVSAKAPKFRRFSWGNLPSEFRRANHPAALASSDFR